MKGRNMALNRTSTPLVGIAAAAVLALAGCGSDGAAASGDDLSGTITVGVPLSLTGVAGAYGEEQRRGIEYAVDEVNASGILGEATIAVKVVDVKEDANQAVTATRGLVADRSVVALAGNTLSNHSLAIAPLAQQSGVPLIVANGADSALSEMGDFIYQMDVRQSSYATKMAEELATRGVKTTAIIANDDVPAVSELVEVYEASALPDAGVDVTTSKTVPSTSTDFSAVVTNALAEDSDAIGVLTRAGAVPIITALRQAGYDGVIWSQAALGGGVAVAAGEVAEGVLYTVNAAAGSPISTMEEFFTGYEERFDRPATAFAAQGHDALWAVALALESAGCGSRECVQEGLGDLMEEGMDRALGPITFEDRAAQGEGTVVNVADGRETWVR
jgi:branched-chain amino acid transport system substrate-binding protein